MIKFNQNSWLKPYIDMNTNLRKKVENDFEKDFFMLMNNSVFGKTVQIVSKHRDIKLVATERRRNYLVLEPIYHTAKFFRETFVSIRNKKKSETLMHKPIYLEISILELSKILMYEFWCG